MSLSFCARAVQRVTRAGARAARQTLAAPAAAATRRAASSVAKAGKAKPVTLSSVLDKELEYEKENGESSVEELAAALTGAGWALHSKDGSARFHVTKSVRAARARATAGGEWLFASPAWAAGRAGGARRARAGAARAGELVAPVARRVAATATAAAAPARSPSRRRLTAQALADDPRPTAPALARARPRPRLRLRARDATPRPPSFPPQFGAQTVRVDVDVTPMPGDEEDAGEEGDEEGRGAQGGEEDEEDGPVDGYRLLVTVTEPSKPTALQFGCFVTDVLRIHRVTAFPAGAVPSADTVFGGADESPAYGGPNFDELDQAVQNAFYEYLADRGVDDAAADKLGDYAAAKENAEYTAWLAAVSAFVK